LNAYFLSPIAYIVMTVFLFLSGIFFFAGLVRTQEAYMRGVFLNMGIILLFISPAISMRLLAEEARSGTIETLMTAPVTDFQAVFGKYLASLGFYIFLLIPTIAYPIMLSFVGNPDWGPVISGYIGLILVGCFYMAVGILASSLTKNQIVAAIVGFVILLVFWLIDIISARGSGAVHEVLQYVTLFYHLDTFVKGLIDSRDVVYYLSMSAFFLFLTVRSVESRKWR
ncbi:MAG: ABC transporter permease, partial [Thermoplasmata archaeon]